MKLKFLIQRGRNHFDHDGHHRHHRRCKLDPAHFPTNGRDHKRGNINSTIGSRSHRAPPPCAGVKVKPCGCCATLTPLVAIA